MSVRPSAVRPPGGSGALASACTVLLLATGCAGDPPRPLQDPGPGAATAAPAAALPEPPAEDWTGQVPVARLVAAAQRRHPTRAAIAATQAAAAAAVRRAGAWDNPELSLDLGRTRPRQTGIETDHPIGGSIAQRLGWWGKRDARIAAARAQEEAAAAGAEAELRELRTEIHRAAIAYAAAREAVAQAEEEAGIAAELAAHAETRLAAGDAARADAARARLEALVAGAAREARQREAATALAVLRTWCDPRLPDGLAVAGAIEAPAPALPGAAAVDGRHPRLRAAAAQAAAADAGLAAERAAGLPDLTLALTAAREAEKDTYGMTIGLVLPLWDRNQAGIAAAEAERSGAQARIRAERLRLERALAEALGALRGAQAEAATLGGWAVPAAEEAVRLREAAVRAGEGGLPELLEARRAASQVRAEERAARRRAALALVDLQAASGEAPPPAAP